MINEMNWTPESLPESEDPSLTRDQFAAAIARFSLYAEVKAARQRVAEAVVDLRVGTVDTHGSSEAVVDLRVLWKRGWRRWRFKSALGYRQVAWTI